MAITLAVFSPAAEAVVTASLATVTSTAEIILGNQRLFSFNADQPMSIKFGNTGMGAAAATDFRIPANTIVTYKMPKNYDRIRVFNISGSTGNYWIQYLFAQG